MLMDTRKDPAGDRLSLLIEETVEEVLRQHPFLRVGSDREQESKKGDKIAQDSLKLFRERLSA
jgi:hypothetical protein